MAENATGVATDNDVRERLLDALYASLADVPMWVGFLRAACAEFACDHASLSFSSWQAGHDEPVLFTDDDNVSAAIGAFYQSGLFAALPRNKSVAIDIPATPDVDAQLDHALVLTLADDHRTICLALWRHAQRGGFGPAAHDLLDGLIAPLRRGISLFFKIAGLERRRIVFDAAIEASDIGVILVDPDANILFTNGIADTLLRTADGLQVAHGKLRAGTPAETTTLLEHLRDKAAEQQAEPDRDIYTPLAIRRTATNLPLTVIVRPGPAFRPLKNPLQRTAMLVLRDPGRRPIIPAKTLTRLFGLTPAESALASEIARGQSLEEAAGQLGVTRNTARTQLQSIFMKTGVNRQGELVRMLLSSAAALSSGGEDGQT